MKKQPRDEPESSCRIAAGAVRGMLSGIAAACITAAAASLILSMQADPDPFIGPASVGALVIGALTAGIVSARVSESAGAPVIAGCGLAALIAVLSVTMGGAAPIPMLVRCMLCIGIAIAGGFAKPAKRIPRHPGEDARRRLARR